MLNWAFSFRFLWEYSLGVSSSGVQEAFSIISCLQTTDRIDKRFFCPSSIAKVGGPIGHHAYGAYRSLMSSSNIREACDAQAYTAPPGYGVIRRMTCVKPPS